RDEWQSYVQTVQSQADQTDRLAIGYAIWNGSHPRVAAPSLPISYVAPHDHPAHALIDLDLYSDARCRNAIDQARDTGGTAIASPISTVFGSNREESRGFIMIAPVYINGARPQTPVDRQKSIQGFVFSPIRISDFILSALVNVPNDIAFTILA